MAARRSTRQVAARAASQQSALASTTSSRRTSRIGNSGPTSAVAIERRSNEDELRSRLREIDALKVQQTATVGQGSRTREIVTGGSVLQDRLRQLREDFPAGSLPQRRTSRSAPSRIRRPFPGISDFGISRFSSRGEQDGPTFPTGAGNEFLSGLIRQTDDRVDFTRSTAAALRPQQRDVQAINELVFRGLRRRRSSTSGVPRSVALLGSAQGDRTRQIL